MDYTITEIKKKLDDIQNQYDKGHADAKKDMCEKYKEFIGKKVRVTFEFPKSARENIRSCDGYLQGFDFTYIAWNVIFPVLMGIKKDGTPSKKQVGMPDWDVIGFEIKLIDE